MRRLLLSSPLAHCSALDRPLQSSATDLISFFPSKVSLNRPSTCFALCVTASLKSDGVNWHESGWERLWLLLAQCFLSHLYGASESLLDFINCIFLNLSKPLEKHRKKVPMFFREWSKPHSHTVFFLLCPFEPFIKFFHQFCFHLDWSRRLQMIVWI